jgi:hypothetical protein
MAISRFARPPAMFWKTLALARGELVELGPSGELGVGRWAIDR